MTDNGPSNDFETAKKRIHELEHQVCCLQRALRIEKGVNHRACQSWAQRYGKLLAQYNRVIDPASQS